MRHIILCAVGLAALAGCAVQSEPTEAGTSEHHVEETQDPNAAAREVARRVHSTYSRATAFGQRLLVGSLFGDAGFADPVSFPEVKRWVCKESTPEDFTPHHKVPPDALKRWHKETKDLFGCGWFNDSEVVFLDDPYRDDEMGVWYDDGLVVIGFMDDYPGYW